MEMAIDVGKKNPSAPFGSVIIRKSTGEVLVQAVNASARDPTLHGEIVAIQECARK
eukprot:CAMPEP_0184365876 /NCGR_PEP_ID=MMETSP1089-20130417/150968_1 /TAXON_ID=38269 ORGANISM="Gloeochaete wittrockiana, Strain SAG46.84" /NCGR_SAMPLE_ID=MMETSP1089 /ASSEMBLY_ACC=CAM_ASM_000445 /LENGTH=55 /DNA_ID=CAMNT_0026707269 /DNA_START=101 /DNA_END=265 /DNA_ORIENTATION=+